MKIGVKEIRVDIEVYASLDKVPTEDESKTYDVQIATVCGWGKTVEAALKQATERAMKEANKAVS